MSLCVAYFTIADSAPGSHDWAPIETHYSMSDGCQSNVDPVTLIFFGAVTPVNQEEMVWSHTGWGSGDAPGGQFISTSYSGCVQTETDRATCSGNCDRRHIRFGYAGPAKFYATAAGQSIDPWTSVVVANAAASRTTSTASHCIRRTRAPASANRRARVP